MQKRKSYNPDFKAKVVLLSLKEEQTIAQIASQHGVHPNQISLWKSHFLKRLLRLRQRQPQKRRPQGSTRKRNGQTLYRNRKTYHPTLLVEKKIWRKTTLRRSEKIW